MRVGPASYTRPAVAAVPPAPERRRPRRGSLERPINGRLYRGTWLLVGLPLLVLAFSVGRPAALQPPALPSAFDRAAAGQIANDLSFRWPIRTPGSTGATGAAHWFASQLTSYGFTVRAEPFTATVPGQGTVQFQNLVTQKAGSSQKTIVVMAHRDDAGTGPGANDNASGTAALIELARTYAPTAGGGRVRLPYTLLFLSTDGAGDGALGAAEFAANSPERLNVIGVVNLDTIAGAGPARLVLTGDTARSPSAGLVETVRSELARQTGFEPGRASTARQLVDLAFPFSLYEQAPFIARAVPAVTITTGADRRAAGFGDTPARLSLTRLGQVGRATQSTIDALEQGVALPPGPSSYVYLGSRIVRGWAIEIVLVAALLPFLTATVDLFARCRRRRIRVSPALRSYRSRLAFWLWCGGLFGLFAVLGVWPDGAARPPSLASVHWPAAGLAVLAVLAALGWLVTRERLLPRRQVHAEEELAGHAAALLALGVVGLLVVATNPVRARLPAPLAPRLALAAAGAGEPVLDPPRGAARRLLGAGAPALVVRGPLRARPRRALVRRLAVRTRLRPAPRLRDRARLGRRRRAAGRAVGAAVRAVSERGGTTPARADPRARPPRRARPAPTARGRCGPAHHARLSCAADST